MAGSKESEGSSKGAKESVAFHCKGCNKIFDLSLAKVKDHWNDCTSKAGEGGVINYTDGQVVNVEAEADIPRR